MKPASPSPRKPVKCWALWPKGQSLEIYHDKEEATENARDWRINGKDDCQAFRVLVIPLDPASCSALVEKAAARLKTSYGILYELSVEEWKDEARDLLAEIGVHSGRKGGR